MQNIPAPRVAAPNLNGQDIERVVDIAQMSGELAGMADALRLDQLARALRIAQEEAQIIVFGQDLAH